MGGQGMRQAARRLLAALLLWACVVGPAAAQEILPELARIGPWPVASRLIGYGGRLWLANSVKGVNHNSADIYSYDPRTGALRYEHRLYSQDAGHPLVSGGLLYWPFEDSRFSLGWGHFMVTDGRRWRLGTIPSARAFHIHAMTVHDGALLAATSAWRAGLQTSSDGGLTWSRRYDHPTPDAKVSRITELAALPAGVVGALRDPAGRRLVWFDGAQVIDLPGWPLGRPVRGLAVRNGWLYGLVEQAGGAQLWRSDGRASQAIGVSRPAWRPRGLAADGRGLWAVEASDSGGLLWFSSDGRDWRVLRRLEGGAPHEVTLYAGEAYVAGAGDDGRGILWGPAWPARVEPAPEAGAATSPLDRMLAGPTGDQDWPAIGAELDRALADPAGYRGSNRGPRDLVYRAALLRPPEDFFAARLSRPVPDLDLSLIGGAARASAAQIARHVLLWGMAVAGRGRVPVELLATPWTAPPNRAEKYFETAQAAIWAVAEIGQADRATIAALIDRLDRPGDPPWLAGDLFGALTALTGQSFGYDSAAWRAWWAEAAWPPAGARDGAQAE